jgi:hypothetical protein
MDKFADIEALTAVVEAGTFSAAGERLGVAKSVVSRRISQLERKRQINPTLFIWLTIAHAVLFNTEEHSDGHSGRGYTD